MDKRILTCAITGAAPIGKDTQVPVTPKEIADSAIGAAKAGAAVVHIHVRNPETGAGSMEVRYYPPHRPHPLPHRQQTLISKSHRV